MTRAEARKVLQSRRGAVARLARELDVSFNSVKDVIQGKKSSARILSAAIDRATELAAEKGRASVAAAEFEERACA